MKKVIFVRGGPILKWADEKILSAPDDRFPEDSLVCALVEGEKIHGACVFTDYRTTTINLHVAGSTTGWITKKFIRDVFSYVFLYLKCNTALGLVRVDNQDAIRFDTKLGFRITGTIPQADDDGTDFYLMSMTKQQCRWIKEKNNGKEK